MFNFKKIGNDICAGTTALKNSVVTHKATVMFLLAVIAYMTFARSYAGSDGGEFDQVYTKITGWAQGTLGRILALTCIVVGTAFTISRGTLIYAVIGIAMCLVLYNAPTVIEGILTATAPADISSEVSGKLPELSNGLFN